MQYSLADNDGATEIKFSGRFTFTDHALFRDLLNELIGKKNRKNVFVLKDVEFIDSAGLGMLLLAREEAQQQNLNISLRGAQGQVKRMFDVARFDTMFTIEN